jgi:hypothetical protein
MEITKPEKEFYFETVAVLNDTRLACVVGAFYKFDYNSVGEPDGIDEVFLNHFVEKFPEAKMVVQPNGIPVDIQRTHGFKLRDVSRILAMGAPGVFSVENYKNLHKEN